MGQACQAVGDLQLLPQSGCAVSHRLQLEIQLRRLFLGIRCAGDQAVPLATRIEQRRERRHQDGKNGNRDLCEYEACVEKKHDA